MLPTHAPFISAFGASLHLVSSSFVPEKLGCSAAREEMEVTNPTALHSSCGPRLLDRTLADNTFSSISARGTSSGDIWPMPVTSEESQKIRQAETEQLPSPGGIPLRCGQLGFGDWYVKKSAFSALEPDHAPLACPSTEEAFRYYEESQYSGHEVITSIALLRNIASGLNSADCFGEQLLTEELAQGRASPGYQHVQSPTFNESFSGEHDCVEAYAPSETERTLATTVVENQLDQSHSTSSHSDFERHQNPSNWTLHPTNEDHGQPSRKKTRLNEDTQLQRYRDLEAFLIGEHSPTDTASWVSGLRSDITSPMEKVRADLFMPLGSHNSYDQLETIRTDDTLQMEGSSEFSQSESQNEHELETKGRRTRKYPQIHSLASAMMSHGIGNQKKGIESSEESFIDREGEVCTVEGLEQINTFDLHQNAVQDQILPMCSECLDGVLRCENNESNLQSFQRGLFVNRNTLSAESSNFPRVMSFSMKKIDPMFLASISSLSNMRSKTAQRKVKENCKEFISRLQKDLHEPLISSPPIDKHLTQMKFDQFQRIKKLEKLHREVWCMNRRILEIFGSNLNENENEAEQNDLMEWLLIQVSGLENAIPFLVSTTELPESSEEPLFSTLHEQVKDYLSSETDEYICKIPQDHSRQERMISKQDILRTKISLYVTGSYYKRTNFRKWNFFFQNENNFLSLLSAIQMRIKQKSHNRILKYKLGLCYSLAIIPWKNNCDTHGLEVQRLKKSMSQDFTKPISNWFKASSKVKGAMEWELVSPRIE